MMQGIILVNVPNAFILKAFLVLFHAFCGLSSATNNTLRIIDVSLRIKSTLIS